MTRRKSIRNTAAITLGILLLALAGAAIGSSGIVGGPQESKGGVAQEELASKLLRLHVIANSDTPEDQALKNAVRDEIIETLEEEFKDIDDIEVSRQYIREHLKDIEELAREKVFSWGKDYNVKVYFGRFPFPVRNYGYITLPAGEYEALRVVIGDGKGANWWCVLFPPLCFVDITHGIAKEETRFQLSGVLTPEEMAMIENLKDPEEVPIQVRFKVVEWWQEAKGKLNHTLKLARHP